VVILAGGAGTRLKPVLKDRPKVLAPIEGIPCLDHLLSYLRSFGARRFILALGIHSEAVKRHVAGVPDVVCSVEPRPMGTGGAVRSVLPKVASDVILVLNGDSILRADLCRFLRFHRSRNAEVTVLLSPVSDRLRYGKVVTDRRGRVRSFGEKSSGGPGFVNAGAYLLSKRAAAGIRSRTRVSLERDFFPGLHPDNFFAFRSRAPFLDIGTPQSYREAGAFLRATRG